jgi:hypothetical protein
MTSPVEKRLRTPRSAALAGIAFAVLLGTAYILLRMSIPEDPTDTRWVSERVGYVKFALGLVPFAGVAFLWFMGVVRDRIGDNEDRFFSTIYTGTGVLFLAMVFVSAAAAGSLLVTYGTVADDMFDSGIYTFGRDIAFQISNVYSIRMAAVFMMSLATVGLRTKALPSWLSITTYVLAGAMVIVVSHSLWITLIFPMWVLVVSVYILVTNLHPSKPFRP